jgi:hypothetical protein
VREETRLQGREIKVKSNQQRKQNTTNRTEAEKAEKYNRKQQQKPGPEKTQQQPATPQPARHRGGGYPAAEDAD